MHDHFQNIALVAALTGGFTVATVLDPSFDVSEDWRCLVVSASGAGVFGLCFACVLDCILIDNSIRLIVDERHMLDFMESESLLLALPKLLLMVIVLLAFVNVAVNIWFLYGAPSFGVAIVIFFAVGVTLFRRYILLS